MIKAVIFDMDGVISDTQHLHDKANSDIVQSYGIPLTPRDLSKWAGIPNKKVFEDIFKQYHVVVNVDEVLDKKWKLVNRRARDASLVPGVLEVIKKLSAQKTSLAVASSSKEEFINQVLESFNLKKYFKVIFSGSELKRGKPYPDIFLLTAKKLQIKPSACLVFEDGPNGVAAAKAARMKCIAITTTHTREALKGADKIIDSFDELTMEEIFS